MVISSIGDYNILKELGRSAFAKVYLAEHKYLKTKFALTMYVAKFEL